MLSKFLLLCSTALCIASLTFAQAGKQPCYTDEHYRQLVNKYPQLADYEQQFEKQIGAKIAAKTTLGSDTTTYDLPMVIHVVHDYGSENLSDDALYNAAAYWAIVYLKQNPDTSSVIPTFVPYIGNTKIRLHLATIDPNGNPTKGIDRIQSYLTASANDQAKLNDWPQNKYVNIWLIGSFDPSMAGVAAYSIYPSAAVYEPFYDGIISLSAYADPATKTIPHEMGHVLNLQHTWGNTNNPEVACGDDHVDDTPPTKGHFSCALYDTVCASGYLKHYTAVIGGGDSIVDYPDTVNTQNIMDYSGCEIMFTKGQCARMRTALTSGTAGRSNLISSANLAATGALAPRPDLAPLADFIVDKATPPAFGYDKRGYFLTFNNASQFQFRNASWRDTVSGVQWFFSNSPSTPTSTSMTSLTNSFGQPGWVTVTLVATSNAGSDTLVNTHAVYAADTTAVGGLSYTQPFSSPSDIANWPMFNYYHNQFYWEFFNGAGVGDNSCIRYRSYDSSARQVGIAIGDHDDIYTPAFNLADASGTVYFNFFSSGAYTLHNIGPGDPRQDDSLEIDASKNGGLSWFKIGAVYGGDLENTGIYGTEFTPTSASQWVPRSVTIPSTYFTGNTFFRFRMWPGNVGNDLYIDQVSISPFPAGVDVVKATEDLFTIYPNPATRSCTLLFKSGSSDMVSYSVKDLTGKVVYESQQACTPNSRQQLELSREAMPVAGMYFVTLTVDGASSTRKLVVY